MSIDEKITTLEETRTVRVAVHGENCLLTLSLTKDGDCYVSFRITKMSGRYESGLTLNKSEVFELAEKITKLADSLT